MPDPKDTAQLRRDVTDADLYADTPWRPQAAWLTLKAASGHPVSDDRVATLFAREATRPAACRAPGPATALRHRARAALAIAMGRNPVADTTAEALAATRAAIATRKGRSPRWPGPFDGDAA